MSAKHGGGGEGTLAALTTCPNRWSSLWIPAGRLEVDTTGSRPHWSKYGWGLTWLWPDLKERGHSRSVLERSTTSNGNK